MTALRLLRTGLGPLLVADLLPVDSLAQPQVTVPAFLSVKGGSCPR